MQIYIVRHGQSLGNIQFTPGEPRPKTEPLTDLGKKQAKQVADQLCKQKARAQVIYSSPYTRAIQTAEIIQKEIKVSLFEDERLGEYYPGEWDGLPEDELSQLFGKISTDNRYKYRPPNGESWHDEATRFRDVIERAIEENYSCVVFVSHYDPIKAVINHLTKKNIKEWGEQVAYPPGSTTILSNKSGDWLNLGQF